MKTEELIEKIFVVVSNFQDLHQSVLVPLGHIMSLCWKRADFVHV